MINLYIRALKMHIRLASQWSRNQGGPVGGWPPNNQAPCYSIYYTILCVFWLCWFYYSLSPLPIHLVPPIQNWFLLHWYCKHWTSHIVTMNQNLLTVLPWWILSIDHVCMCTLFIVTIPYSSSFIVLHSKRFSIIRLWTLFLTPPPLYLLPPISLPFTWHHIFTKIFQGANYIHVTVLCSNQRLFHLCFECLHKLQSCMCVCIIC